MKTTDTGNGRPGSGGLYYRRKVLLALLQVFGGRLTKLDFQKYLFLFTRCQESPSYEFIPYKFGCYSLQCAADKRTLAKYNLLAPAEDWIKSTPRDFLSQLHPDDKQKMFELKKSFGHLQGNELVRYVYRTHPYYAINSEIAENLLPEAELKQIRNHKPRNTGSRFFTIGYEGKPFEQYLRQLIDHSVSVLCDVRKNALSMKFGFSKTQLKNAVESLGMMYVHMPELGIDSSKRKQLETSSDYEELFREYERTILPRQRVALNRLQTYLATHKRVAITCFERDHQSCHRGRVANALQALPDWDIKIEHL